MDVLTTPPVGSSTVPQSTAPADVDSSADLCGADNEIRRRLLNRIEEQTIPALPPKKWGWLKHSQSVRTLSGDASNLVASLKNEFGEAELCAAGVLEQGTSGVLRLSSILGGADSSFLIRRDPQRLPIDVVSARGSLSNARHEWLQLAAQRADTTTDRPGVVLTAFDDNEILILHRLGFKLTPADGLAMICDKHVHELFTTRPRHREQCKYMLTIPGWQIANCINEPTPQTQRAIAQIAEIPRHYRYDPSAVFTVWLPTDSEFHEICGALKFAGIRLVSAALRKSLSQSQYSPADALRIMSDRTDISYGVARRQLIRAVEASRFAPRAGEIDVALTKFWKAFQKSVVDKFIKFADGDGWEEWRSMNAVEFAETWFNKLEIVAAAKRGLAGEFPNYRQGFDNDLFESQMRMADSFARLYRLKPPANSLLRKN